MIKIKEAMMDFIIIVFFIIMISSWIIYRPINRLITIYKNWIRLEKFIKKGREDNISIFKINTTSDKLIITTKSKNKAGRLSLDYD